MSFLCSKMDSTEPAQFVIDHFFSLSLLLCECQFWRRHKHIYAYDGNNR